MNFKKCFLALILFFIPVFFMPVVSAEEILWPYFHYPPLYIVENGKVSGYGMTVQEIISRQMSEYTHKMILAQPARLFKDMKDGEKYVAYGPVKTPERELYLYYSLPCRLVFTDAVVMNKNAAKKYLIGSLISLKKLASDQKLVMGHSKDASYGNRIDSILKAHKSTLKQEIITGEEAETRQLKMILNGRIDWMIWDPLTLKILLGELNMHGDVQIYEIYEKEQTFIYAHIAVPKTPWGKQVISKINKILKTAVTTDEFYSGLSKWIPDELKPSFRKGYEEYIIKPAKEYKIVDQ